MNVSGILTPGESFAHVTKLSRVKRRRSSMDRIVSFGSAPARPVPIPRTNRLSVSFWIVESRRARRPGSCSRIRITPLPMRSLLETARLPEQMSSDVKPPWLPSGTKRWDKDRTLSSLLASSTIVLGSKTVDLNAIAKRSLSDKKSHSLNRVLPCART